MGDSDKSWVRHELYKDMPHDFQIASGYLAHAELAMKQYSRFVHEVFNGRIEDNSFTEKESKLIKMVDSHIFEE